MGLVVDQGEEGQQVGEHVRKAYHYVEDQELRYGEDPRIGQKSV